MNAFTIALGKGFHLEPEELPPSPRRMLGGQRARGAERGWLSSSQRQRELGRASSRREAAKEQPAGTVAAALPRVLGRGNPLLPGPGTRQPGGGKDGELAFLPSPEACGAEPRFDIARLPFSCNYVRK
ncbi:uncharacterized protein VK521_007741 [Ammospiza maritima maritima]